MKLLHAYLVGCAAVLAVCFGALVSQVGSLLIVLIGLVVGALSTSGARPFRAWSGALAFVVLVGLLAADASWIGRAPPLAWAFALAAGACAGGAVAVHAAHARRWPAALGGLLTGVAWAETLTLGFGGVTRAWVAVGLCAYVSESLFSRPRSHATAAEAPARCARSTLAATGLLGAAWAVSSRLAGSHVGDALDHVRTGNLLHASASWSALGALAVLVARSKGVVPRRGFAGAALLAAAGWLGVAIVGRVLPDGALTHALADVFGLRPMDGRLHDLAVASAALGLPAFALGAALALLPDVGAGPGGARVAALVIGFTAGLAGTGWTHAPPALPLAVAVAALLVAATVVGGRDSSPAPLAAASPTPRA